MLFANNANTTLASSLTNSATTMSVTSASAFPSPTGSQYFYCTLADAATQTTIEIVKVTAVSGTTFTIVRGQDGTSGTAFASGAVVSLRLVRASLNDFPKLDEANTFTQAQTFSALTVGRIPFSGTGGLQTDDANLFWDNTNKRLGIGTSTPSMQGNIYGAGQAAQTTISTSSGVGGSLFLQDSGGSTYNGGALFLGSSGGAFAFIKGGLTNGTGPLGQLIFGLRKATSDTTLSTTHIIDTSGNFFPYVDATQNLGGASNRWNFGYFNSVVYASGFIPAGSSVPTNGMFLPAANTLGFATNSAQAMQIGSTGGVSIGNTTDPGAGALRIKGSLVNEGAYSSTYHIDTTPSSITLATSGTVNISNFSGMVMVNNTATGGNQVWLCGGGATTSIGSNGSGGGGTLTYNSGIGGYTFTSTYVSTASFGFVIIRTRTTA